jgi:hypothetical protein
MCTKAQCTFEYQANMQRHRVKIACFAFARVAAGVRVIFAMILRFDVLGSVFELQVEWCRWIWLLWVSACISLLHVMEMSHETVATLRTRCAQLRVVCVCTRRVLSLDGIFHIFGLAGVLETYQATVCCVWDVELRPNCIKCSCPLLR